MRVPPIIGLKAVQKSGAPLIGAVVGNKCDFRDGSLESRAEVGLSEARSVAEAMGMKHFETSAVSML